MVFLAAYQIFRNFLCVEAEIRPQTQGNILKKRAILRITVHGVNISKTDLQNFFKLCKSLPYGILSIISNF